MDEKRWLYFVLGVTTVLSLGAVTNQLAPVAPLPTTIETDGTVQADGFLYSGQGVGTLGEVETASGFKFPDGTVQTTAAAGHARPGFYLTVDTFDGAGALGACVAPGYHMAQLSEILDPSNSRYASEALGARNTGHDGAIPSGFISWVRTGWGPNVSTPPAKANCDLWTSNDPAHLGTDANLKGDWNPVLSSEFGYNGWLGPWIVNAATCGTKLPVWCVED